MASTLLASITIVMSSVITVLMSHGAPTNEIPKEGALEVVLGDRSPLGFSIKFFSILACFLLAFLLNVQSIRYYSHASILVNLPFKKLPSPYLNAEYVARAVNWGGYFRSLGLHAFYFSFPLFLWIFGPISMFLSCVALVVFLYFLDATFEFRAIDRAFVESVSHDDVQQPDGDAFSHRK